MIKYSFFILLVFVSILSADLKVGVATVDITPPPLTPSAGYMSRKGAPMKGVLDPLLATSLFMDNGTKKIAICSVDHLGFTYEMVKNVRAKVNEVKGLEFCDVYICSSHTHAGGGAYLNLPMVGEPLAGPYNPEVTQSYIDKTVDAIISSSENCQLAKIGINSCKLEGLTQYRATFPEENELPNQLTLIKVTSLEGKPLSALFNFAIHPTVLTGENFQFSSDFVGFAREHLKESLGKDLQPLFVNGAQGDVGPVILNQDRYLACDKLGKKIADTVHLLWLDTTVSDDLNILTEKEHFSFKPQATPAGMLLPIEKYETEMNIILFNKKYAFITIPGELSSIYDKSLKITGTKLDYLCVSIFGLTNDAHGYIITPEAWRHKTNESSLSFGGEFYGDEIKHRAEMLLKNNR